MAKAILHFVVIVLAFLLISHVVPGFYLRDWRAAIVAALLFGIVNATLGLVLKIITFPLILLTFGLFYFVVNAVLLLLVAFLLGSSFSINGFLPAFVAAILLAAVNLLWKAVSRSE